jgi:hypothetical protein
MGLARHLFGRGGVLLAAGVDERIADAGRRA